MYWSLGINMPVTLVVHSLPVERFHCSFHQIDTFLRRCNAPHSFVDHPLYLGDFLRRPVPGGIFCNCLLRSRSRPFLRPSNGLDVRRSSDGSGATPKIAGIVLLGKSRTSLFSKFFPFPIFCHHHLLHLLCVD